MPPTAALQRWAGPSVAAVGKEGPERDAAECGMLVAMRREEECRPIPIGGLALRLLPPLRPLPFLPASIITSRSRGRGGGKELRTKRGSQEIEKMEGGRKRKQRKGTAVEARHSVLEGSGA